MLAAALRRNGGNGAFQDLQQSLLHALAGHVAGDRRVLRLAGDLVHLIDVDNAALGLRHVEVGGLEKLQQDVLYVFTDVAGFGQTGGVSNGERHIEHPGERLRQIGLARTGRPQHQNVGLRQLHLVVGAASGGVRLLDLDALVVVVHGDGQGALGLVLADHVAIQELGDGRGLRQLRRALRGIDRQQLLFDDLVTKLDAFVANVNTRAGNQLADLLLALSTEGALQELCAFRHAGHQAFLDRVTCGTARLAPS